MLPLLARDQNVQPFIHLTLELHDIQFGVNGAQLSAWRRRSIVAGLMRCKRLKDAALTRKYCWLTCYVARALGITDKAALLTITRGAPLLLSDL